METIYQRIFEYTPDALLVVDQAGCITLVNAQAETLFGYDRSELVGQPIEMLVPPRFAVRHVGHRAGFMGEAHSRQMGRAIELFALQKNCGELPVDIMLSPMALGGRSLTLCVVRDITERKAAENKLRQQTEELRKLHSDLKELATRKLPPSRPDCRSAMFPISREQCSTRRTAPSMRPGTRTATGYAISTA